MFEPDTVLLNQRCMFLCLGKRQPDLPPVNSHGHPHRPTTTGAQAASAIIATSAAIASANSRRRAMLGSLLKAGQAIGASPSRHRLNSNNEIRLATVSTRDAAGSESDNCRE
jgi:hypothetical protein